MKSYRTKREQIAVVKKIKSGLTDLGFSLNNGVYSCPVYDSHILEISIPLDSQTCPSWDMVLRRKDGTDKVVLGGNGTTSVAAMHCSPERLLSIITERLFSVGYLTGIRYQNEKIQKELKSVNDLISV